MYFVEGHPDEWLLLEITTKPIALTDSSASLIKLITFSYMDLFFARNVSLSVRLTVKIANWQVSQSGKLGQRLPSSFHVCKKSLMKYHRYNLSSKNILAHTL